MNLITHAVFNNRMAGWLNQSPISGNSRLSLIWLDLRMRATVYPAAACTRIGSTPRIVQDTELIGNPRIASALIPISVKLFGTKVGLKLTLTRDYPIQSNGDMKWTPILGPRLKIETSVFSGMLLQGC